MGAPSQGLKGAFLLALRDRPGASAAPPGILSVYWRLNLLVYLDDFSGHVMQIDRLRKHNVYTHTVMVLVAGVMMVMV